MLNSDGGEERSMSIKTTCPSASSRTRHVRGRLSPVLGDLLEALLVAEVGVARLELGQLLLHVQLRAVR